MGSERCYAKDVYTKEVILKAAYAFTDGVYIHIDTDERYYKITLKSKDDKYNSEEMLYADFENELIAQETRRMISENTKNLREMIVARALSSTIVNRTEVCDDGKSTGERENNRGNSEQDRGVREEESFSAADILKDWFETYEE